jgi:thiol-disulfide isomerase/thioredoxin
LSFLLASACEDKNAPPPPPPPTARPEIVSAKPTQTAAATTSAQVANKPRQGCNANHPAVGKKLPVTTFSHVETEGVASLPDKIMAPSGHTWINLWAAWCGPCRAEIPLLVSWQSKLKAAGKSVSFSFLSLDDDERETRAMLAKQPKDGLQATYMLPEPTRKNLLLTLGFPAEQGLPVQVIVDENARVKCVIDGEVTEADYAWIAKMF